MSIKGVPQLRTLLLRYSDRDGSSRGIRCVLNEACLLGRLAAHALHPIARGRIVSYWVGSVSDSQEGEAAGSIYRPHRPSPPPSTHPSGTLSPTREYIGSRLVAFARQHEHVTVKTELKRNAHPFVRAEYGAF